MVLHLRNSIEPLLLEYDVDVVLVGHVHKYERTWYEQLVFITIDLKFLTVQSVLRFVTAVGLQKESALLVTTTRLFMLLSETPATTTRLVFRLPCSNVQEWC